MSYKNSFLRKVALIGTLAGSALFSGCYSPIPRYAQGSDFKATPVEIEQNPAKEPEGQDPQHEDLDSHVEREITLDIANPIENSEASTRLWYTLGELTGKANEALGKDVGWDKNILGRVGLLLLHNHLSRWNQIASHEMAHVGVGKTFGDYSFSFDLSHPLNPAENFHNNFRYEPTPEQNFKEDIAGLNQDELNARFLFWRTQKEGSLTLDRAVSFLWPKLSDLGYVLTTDKKSLEDDSHDVGQYLSKLRTKGVNLPKDKYLLQVAIADLLTMHNWKSLAVITKYLADGSRSIEGFGQPMLHFENGLRIGFPIVSHYLTTKGSFYDIGIPIKYGGNSLEISFGSDADFIGDGDVNRLRLGAKANRTPLFNLKGIQIEFSPEAYFNFRRTDLKPEGVALGSEFYFPITEDLELRARVGYQTDDLIKSSVEGEGTGFDAAVGFDLRF